MPRNKDLASAALACHGCNTLNAARYVKDAQGNSLLNVSLVCRNCGHGHCPQCSRGASETQVQDINGRIEKGGRGRDRRQKGAGAARR